MTNKDIINELLPLVRALVYYSQIHTVKGVQPVDMLTHDEAWRATQQWLWNNCHKENGEYVINNPI